MGLDIDFHPIKQISSAVGEAQQWMEDRADDAREFISDSYDDMTAQASAMLLEHVPEPLREGVGAITAGTSKIGKQVVEFLDPVGYGLEVGADVLGTAFHGPKEAVESFKMMAHGDVAGGLTRWGKMQANTYLTEAEVLATVLPTGHIAGKVAKQPIKAARKSLKAAKKAAPRGSVERKAIKQDLRHNSMKKHGAKMIAKNSAQLADELVRQSAATGKQRLDPREKFQAPKRDWSKLGLQDPTSYYYYSELPKKNRRR